MENNCKKVQQPILESITGTLPAEKASEFQLHISSCPACRKYLKALQADDKLLGDFAKAMLPAVARLENNVIEALSREISDKQISSISIW